MKNAWARRRSLLILITYVAWSFFSLIPVATAAAVDFNYDTQVNYHVEDNGTTSVTENYTVTNNTSRQYLTQLKLLTPTQSLSGLSVAYSDGGAIPATTSAQNGSRGDFKFSYQEIDMTFPRQIYGSGKTWKFSVHYVASGLVDSKGSAHTVYVPSIEAGDAADTYSVTVDVPASYGNPHFPGASSANGGVNGGRQFYNFNKSDLTTQALALAFGDATIYSLNFNYPLFNDSPLPHTLTVTLPPDLNNQRSYVNSLSPQPSSTRLDADGNVLADYKLQPHQKLTVTTDVSDEVKYLEYDLGASKTKKDIPADLVQTYTRGTTYWPTNGTVADAAKKITDPNAPVINNVKAVYQFVIDKLTYNKDKIQFNVRQGATKALANPGNAVCLEYADLMVAMLRSQGIPARMPVGYAYSGDLKSSSDVADSLHAWVEAYVPGIGWMTFDPTWGEKFDEFGKSDLDHVAFAVWGASDASPTAEMNHGTDQSYQYENTKLAFKSSVTAVAASGNVSGQRWIIAPFIALDRVSVTSQQQISTDDNVVVIDGHKVSLGSLAPGQRTTVTRLALGGAWLHAASVTFGHGDIKLAAAKLPATPLGIIVTLGVALIIVVAWIGTRRLRARHVPVTESPLPTSQPPIT